MDRNAIRYPGPTPRKAPEYRGPVSFFALKEIFSSCGDFESRALDFGLEGAVTVKACWLDGLVSGSQAAEEILRPLTDRLRASIPGITTDELIRLDLLAQTAVFTSQGVPFMLCGEEMLRDKKGVHNSFESPDDINHLDWANLDRYPQVFDYYSHLIALRQHHPAFRLGSADLVRKHLEFLDAPKNVVAFRLKNYAGRDDWRDIIVVLNANKEEACIDIPQADYTVVCEKGVINERGIRQFNGHQAIAAPQSALILHD